MDWAKAIARRDEKHLSFGIWCDLYYRFDIIFILYHLYIQLQFPRQHRLTYVRFMQRAAGREQFKDVILDFGLGRSMQVIVQKSPPNYMYYMRQFCSVQTWR